MEWEFGDKVVGTGEISKPQAHQGRIPSKATAVLAQGPLPVQAPSKASFKFCIHNFSIFLL